MTTTASPSPMATLNLYISNLSSLLQLLNRVSSLTSTTPAPNTIGMKLGLSQAFPPKKVGVEEEKDVRVLVREIVEEIVGLQGEYEGLLEKDLEVLGNGCGDDDDEEEEKDGDGDGNDKSEVDKEKIDRINALRSVNVLQYRSLVGGCIYGGNPSFYDSGFGSVGVEEVDRAAAGIVYKTGIVYGAFTTGKGGSNGDDGVDIDRVKEVVKEVEMYIRCEELGWPDPTP